MSAPSLIRQVSLGPGIPRVDIEPLDLPPAKPAPKAEKCWLCNGTGQTLNSDRSPRVCGCCGGTGEIGGGR